MKNPIIIDGEILLSDEDIFLFIRERLGNEIANEIQRIIDDLRIENEELHFYENKFNKVEAETRKLIRHIETGDEILDRTELRNQALKIFKIINDL